MGYTLLLAAVFIEFLWFLLEISFPVLKIRTAFSGVPVSLSETKKPLKFILILILKSSKITELLMLQISF